jgi:hypothetical protein
MNKIKINNKTSIKLEDKEISLIELSIKKIFNIQSTKLLDNKNKKLNKWKTQSWNIYK